MRVPSTKRVCIVLWDGPDLLFCIGPHETGPRSPEEIERSERAQRTVDPVSPMDLLKSGLRDDLGLDYIPT